jgi:hypothetical protein
MHSCFKTCDGVASLLAVRLIHRPMALIVTIILLGVPARLCWLSVPRTCYLAFLHSSECRRCHLRRTAGARRTEYQAL